MRRTILWIIAIMISFAIGTGTDSLRHYLVRKELPKVEAPPAAVAAPVAATPTRAVIPRQSLILDYDPQKFVPLVTLYILGPAPKGFSDFDFIQVDVPVGDDVDYHGYIAVYSGSNQKHSETAPANFALVTQHTLYFTTSPSQANGFEYHFDGQFLVKDFQSVAGKNMAAVRGVLTKSRDGRTIAEHTITFRIEYGDC